MARNAKPRDLPPPLELECLKALWVLGEGNVRDVREVLCRDRALAYTTVMTVLDRLARRGGAERRKAGRSFVYAPVFSRECLRKMAIQELIDCFFDGSEDELRDYLSASRPDMELPSLPVDGRLDASLL